MLNGEVLNGEMLNGEVLNGEVLNDEILINYNYILLFYYYDIFRYKNIS